LKLKLTPQDRWFSIQRDTDLFAWVRANWPDANKNIGPVKVKTKIRGGRHQGWSMPTGNQRQPWCLATGQHQLPITYRHNLRWSTSLRQMDGQGYQNSVDDKVMITISGRSDEYAGFLKASLQ